jgi:sulfite oxidase
VDEESLDLTVELANGERKVYTIQDLQCKFTQHTITATLQCSGNRRSDMSANSRKAQGLPWGIGAISNSSWTGVRLRDVLADAGLSSDPSTAATTCSSSTLAQHVHLIGAEAYAVSVPIHKAIDPWGDVLLVHAMNGQPLSRDHGYPLRVIVPGYVAARSVKWLNKIVLSNEESQSTWHQKDYKCFGPNETSATIDWDKAPSIMEFPVQSAITKIMETSIQSAETTSEDAAVTISGYAHSGGGRRITRVDVSTDDGKSWKQAELLHQDEALGHRAWSWTQWRLIVPKDAVGVACVVKAVDEANNTQPESYAPFWNVRGNLTNSWHRVEVQL